MIKNFSNTVLKWYDKHGRKDLPWQKKITPYRVWVSEIMLQQTQVNTVIPYFQNFMAKYPDVFSLAKAKTDDVMNLWSGLGYYARARNLHQCAKTIVKNHQGEFPDSQEVLETLPGIGRSTAGAILSLSMNKPAAILDGNVKRVLCRVHAIEGWPGQTLVNKKLWEIAEQYTPKKRNKEYTQAMMDLGAIICTRSKPNCNTCPLAKSCQAYNAGEPTAYPHKKKKATLPIRHKYFLLIINQQNELLLEKRPPNGIWGGLWAFPEAENLDEIEKIPQHNFNCQVQSTEAMELFRHTFSHFHLDITPVIVKTKEKSQKIMDSSGLFWYKLSNSLPGGIAAPVNKILKELELSI